MTKTQISYFLEVAKCLNFSKAAENLYVSQPAVSKQISLMEAELGFPLFDRTNKVIRLTESGAAMQSLLSRYDRDLDALIAHLQARSGSAVSGTLNIGFRASWNAAPFYRCLTRIFSPWPEVRFSLACYEHGELLPHLRSGELDFALIYDKEVENRSEFVARPFASPEYELIYSADLAGIPADPVSLTDFASADFLYVDNSVGESIRRHAEALCKEYGFTPGFRCYRNIASALQEVNCGRGVMLVEAWEMAHTNSVFRKLPLGGSLQIDLVSLAKTASPLTEFVLTELQHHLPIPAQF